MRLVRGIKISSAIAIVTLAFSSLVSSAAFGSTRSVDSSSGHNVCTVSIDNADASAAWTDLVQNTYDAIHADNCSADGDSIFINISVDILAPEDSTSATGWDTHGLDLSDTNADVTITGTNASASVIDLNHFNTDYELRFITKSTGVGDITLDNLVIKNGYADADISLLYKAGAILDTPSNDSKLNITNCSFYHNYGWGSGGAIYANQYVDMAINYSLFGDTSGNGNFTNSIYGDAPGGAIYTEGNFSDNGSIFAGNSTNSSDGGAVYLAGDSTFTKQATFSGTEFDSNSAGNDGGAIYATQNVSPLTINQDSNFTSNAAYGQHGGAIATFGGLVIDQSSFSDNGSYLDGGAIYTDGLTLEVDRSYFDTNFSVIGNGGAIYAVYPEIGDSLFGDYFYSNEAAIGGAVSLGSYDNALIDSSTFTDNISTYAGGAIFIDGGGEIRNSTIWKNFSGTYGAIAVVGTMSLDFDTIGFNTDTTNWTPSSHDFGNPLNLGGDSGNEFDGVGNLILSDASDSTGSCSMDSTFMDYVVTNDTSCFGNSSSLIVLQNNDLDYASNLAKNSSFNSYYNGSANTQGPRTIRVTDNGGFDPRIVPADVAARALDCADQDSCLDGRGYLRGGFKYSTTHFDYFMAGAYEQTYDPEFTSANGRGIVHLDGTTWASDGSTSNLDMYGHFFNYNMGVDIDGQACTNVAVISSTHLICSVPANTKQIVKITLTAPNGDQNDFNNSISYTDGPAPTISSLSAATGTTAGGDTITIHGANFVDGASAKIGGRCATLTFVSSSQLTCVTGSHIAANVQVEVDNPDWLFGTADGLFAYVAPSGPSNHTITVTTPTNGTITQGTNAAIADGSTPIYTITPATGYQIASVTVDSTDVTGSLVGAGSTKTYTFPSVTANHTISATFSLVTGTPAPTVASVSPNTGTVEGGTPITISGNHFVAGATVTVGGSSCTSVSVISATSITCNTPDHAEGAVDIVVTNPDNQHATLSVAFTYQAAPVLPSSPGKPSATAGDGSVDLSWNAPASGTAPFTYSVTSTPSGATCTVSGTTAHCTGLTNGTAYTFTITARNAAGSGTSVASESVIPQVATPTPPPVISPNPAISYNLIGFGYNSAKLRTSLKVKIRNFVTLNPEATTFVCQGYTSGKKVTKLAKKLGLARAKAVCAYIAKLVPGAKVSVAKKLVNIPLSRRARRVRITAIG